ncbi:MAG: chemotaxis protein CheD, partial [Opitutaceae bacterium]
MQLGFHAYRFDLLMAGSPHPPSTFGQRVIVGVGDAASSNNGNVTLSTYGLGSCVGVVAYDSDVGAGGMLHLMLPHSSIAPAKALTQPAMFADTGLPLFFAALQGLKMNLDRLRLVLVGGASVLSGKDAFKIGERNLEAIT